MVSEESLHIKNLNIRFAFSPYLYFILPEMITLKSTYLRLYYFESFRARNVVDLLSFIRQIFDRSLRL